MLKAIFYFMKLILEGLEECKIEAEGAGDISLFALPPGVAAEGEQPGPPGPPGPPPTCSIDPLCFMKYSLKALYYYLHALEGGKHGE